MRCAEQPTCGSTRLPDRHAKDLLEHGAVEQLAHLLEGAVEVVPLQQLAASLGDLPREVVDALKALGDIPQDFSVDRLFLPGVTEIAD